MCFSGLRPDLEERPGAATARLEAPKGPWGSLPDRRGPAWPNWGWT